MRTSARNTPSTLLAVASVALLLASGCSGDDGPGKLFDENGVWSLTQYNLTGDGLNQVDNDVRGDAFMMKFSASEQVVQVAMCGETEQDTPGNSQCRLIPMSTQWFCKCYAYAYEGDVMYWEEFGAGGAPPNVDFPDNDMPAPVTTTTSGGVDTDGMGDTGGDTGASGSAVRVQLSEVANIGATYQLRPLPTGVWGSDGSISSYTIQQKAPSVFDQVDEDPDGRTSCQPCI